MRRGPIVGMAATLAALLVAACGASGAGVEGLDKLDRRADRVASISGGSVRAEPAGQTAPGRPNIVFVLMDDFSVDLLPTMRSALWMARAGASYDHAYVVDSLCCVSRSATFTGQYPHQTGVRTNTANLPNRAGPMGGWAAFARYGNRARTFALRLQRSGYVTGYVGKYLNGYEIAARHQTLPPVPPGWSDFRAIFGSAYDGWGFQSARTTNKGQQVIRNWPAPPASAPARVRDRSYAGAVLAHQTVRFLRERRGDPRPYFLEVAPYAPHGRVDSHPAYRNESLFPAAFRDQPSRRHPRGNCGLVDCRDLTVRDLPGFGDRRARQWNRDPLALTRSQAQNNLRDRARMAQSVDRLVQRILRMVDDNTYVVLTSDNGLHLGQLGLLRGKGTPYDTDTHVPLLVVGPGVVPGHRDAMVSNIDWAPTFESLAGLDSPAYRSGISMVPTFTDPATPLQDYVFFEHTFSKTTPGTDPDRPFTGGGLNVIPSYVAVRSRTALLVRNDLDPRWDHERYAYEFYDYTSQPWERTNQFDDPAYAAEVRTLLARLGQFDACASIRRDDPVPPECRQLTIEAPPADSGSLG